MITTLIRKELHALRPFIGLVLVFSFFSIADLLFKMPHMSPFAKSFGDYIVSKPESSVVIFLFVLALTSGLLVREYDEGTIEFLDSLPVSRTAVFLAKTLTAFIVLMGITLFDMGIGMTLHAISRDSLDPGFHWLEVVKLFGLRTLQLLTMFSIGLAASFMRRFGWLAIGIAIWLFMMLKDRFPAVEIVNFFALSTPGVEGQTHIIPQGQVYASIIISVVLLTASFFIFHSGDRMMTGYSRMSQTRLGGAFLLFGSICMGVVVMALIYFAGENGMFGAEDSAEEITVDYPSWNTSRARTVHFKTIYPANMTAKANSLLKDADGVYETVSKVLGSEMDGEILLDATSAMPRHAGLATWHTIRMDLTASDDIETLRSILGHETAHVMMEEMSDRRLSSIANSTRFWHEGVASYIEFHHFETETNIRDYYRQVAFMRDRDEVDFEELINNAKLVEKYDTLLAYSLGMIFVESLVERYSEEAIGEIVNAMNREDAPRGLTGISFWRDTFQSCGYSLDEVVNAFYERLDREVANQREWLDSIPEFRPEYSEDEFDVYVEIDWEPNKDWSPICRFRQTADAPDRQYRTTNYDEDFGFSWYRDFFPAGLVWYQLGLVDSDGVTIFLPWEDVAMD